VQFSVSGHPVQDRGRELVGPAHALCFFEWASANEQNVIVDWVTISGENDARDVAQSIAQGTESICRPHIYQCRY